MPVARHVTLLSCLLATLGCQTSTASGPPPAPAPVAPTAPAASASVLEPSPVAAPEAAPKEAMRKFSEDVEFLSKHGPVAVLESPAGGLIAVSGKYQARVMTSAVEATGASLGFVNRGFIEQGKTGTPFDNYGGEDRFWLGPEGGQYALYFAPGKPFQFEHWQTPAAFQEGEWLMKEGGTASSVTFSRTFSLTNYAKTQLDVAVERKLTVMGNEQASEALGLEPPKEVKWVGFASENTITNRGKKPWTEQAGLPSIWILGMFMPAPGTTVIAPFEKTGKGEIVNDRYFGKVPADRLLVNADKGFALFKCDGQLRSKIGLGPARAKAMIGSYSAAGKMLTVVRYTRPAGAQKYVNNLWEISKQPYAGDVNNAYNDGPVEPGKPSLGGFYELESSSPAAALAPGKSLTHVHETYHFIGPREQLETLAQKLLGVSLTDVESAKL